MDDLKELLRIADQELEMCGGGLSALVIAAAVGLLVLLAIYVGFWIGVGIGIVVGLIAMSVVGSITEKMDKRLLETKYRRRILELAAAAGLTRSELAQQFVPHYKSLSRSW